MAVVVMINGRVHAPEEAKVSVFDRGFLYGDSVFETVRTYRGRPFALDQHLARLARSAELVFIELPVPLVTLEAEVLQALAAAGNGESYVRVMITRGESALGLDTRLADHPSRVIIVADLNLPPARYYQDGIATVTYRTERATDATAAEGAKVGNYLVSVLAMRQASLAGAAEALIVDARGAVVEGATSNVFMLEGGTLVTPGAGILQGITRAEVLKAAADLGLPVRFRAPSLDELLAADEAFITSSLREMLPVVKVDGTAIGTGRPGAQTLALHARFKQRIDAWLARA
ncbi:MAG: aminotransferase class IV [Polyangiaceae bacterium]